MTTTSDDMIERVAREILKARYYDCEPKMYGNDVGMFFAVLDSDLVRDAEYEARAAIEAMQPAILAERERCAKIAERYGAERAGASDGQTYFLRDVNGLDIAHAIRSQS